MKITHPIGKPKDLVALFKRFGAFAQFRDDAREFNAHDGFGGQRWERVFALALKEVQPVEAKVLVLACGCCRHTLI